MSLMITGGRLIDPPTALTAKRPYIEPGASSLGVGYRASADSRPTRTIDANGKIVCPGLVGPARGCANPASKYKATIES